MNMQKQLNEKNVTYFFAFKLEVHLAIFVKKWIRNDEREISIEDESVSHNIDFT